MKPADESAHSSLSTISSSLFTVSSPAFACYAAHADHLFESTRRASHGCPACAIAQIVFIDTKAVLAFGGCKAQKSPWKLVAMYSFSAKSEKRRARLCPRMQINKLRRFAAAGSNAMRNIIDGEGADARDRAALAVDDGMKHVKIISREQLSPAAKEPLRTFF
jgi:hypothetical protein